MKKTTLYSKDAIGNIRAWSIHNDSDHIYITSGLYGGEENVHTERIAFGLGGRTKEEQINMRIRSRINKKIDSGYCYSIEDAKNNVKTNNLGYLKAMKCTRWDQEYKKIPFTKTYIQPKLDGHHCSIINDNGIKVAYSNGGKIINSIDHILDGIDLPVGESIEGELYIHGLPLQTISSYVRKKQEGSMILKYYCYDIVSDLSYDGRYERLRSIDFGAHAELLQTDLVHGSFDIKPILSDTIKEGYEGLVVRLVGHPYEAGKRSKGMIKVKPMHFDGEFSIDDEFLVVDINQSKDGWAILVCETEEGAQFKVSCFGNMEYKKYVWDKKDDFISKHIRVQFSGLTKDKKPFHPVAIEWREKFDE